MTDDEAWKVEAEFWTGGAAHYRRHVDPHCLMAFPEPAGIMTFETVMHALDDMPRWSSVELTGKVLRRPAQDAMVLAYRAEGRRAGGQSYNAICTSTYRLAEARWLLMQHQQTPV
jgi:hypothetical protein